MVQKSPSYLSYIKNIKRYFEKKIEKYHHFDSDDLWSQNHCDLTSNLARKRYQGSSRAI